MREMKDSGIEWIGEIPKEWDCIKGKNVFINNKFIPGVQSHKYERLSLTLNGVVPRSKEDSNGLQPTDFFTYQLLKENDLVFKLIDLQNISTSRIGLAHSTGLVSPAYIVLHSKGRVIPSYAEKYYLMMWHRQIFNALGDSGVRSSLNATELLNIKITIPSLEEQWLIADFLDEKCGEIDSLTKDIQEQIETLQEYKKSIITEVVTKGLDPNAEMKDSGIEWIGEIPKDWKLIKIKNLTTSYSGGTPDRLNMSFWEDGKIPWIASGEVNKGYIYETAEKITDLGLKSSSAKMYPINTVLFALNGQGKTKGLSAITKIYACGNQSLVGFICNDQKLNYSYLNYCFIAAYKYNRSYYGGGDKRDGISAGRIKNSIIPCPSIQEQQQIADYLDNKCSQIDQIIEEKHQQLNTLAEYKKSIIYEYVTGKKEVQHV